jgi:MerR family transcriptional regulator/heat shock protein HspR
MNQPIFTREQVAEQFALAPSMLRRYEARGLVHTVVAGDLEGYGPSEVRRLWSIVTLQRDLGINLAGVEAVLKLRSQIDTLHSQMQSLANELQTIADTAFEEPSDG